MERLKGRREKEDEVGFIGVYGDIDRCD